MARVGKVERTEAKAAKSAGLNSTVIEADYKILRRILYETSTEEKRDREERPRRRETSYSLKGPWDIILRKFEVMNL